MQPDNFGDLFIPSLFSQVGDDVGRAVGLLAELTGLADCCKLHKNMFCFLSQRQPIAELSSLTSPPAWRASKLNVMQIYSRIPKGFLLSIWNQSTGFHTLINADSNIDFLHKPVICFPSQGTLGCYLWLQSLN